ncbi:hypothetical protein [Novosphingobium resinovorum]|uniref:hypothetical protein n=1 Tax=Novosphingobium resinovorum TaxID=158500 RepID=UPI002ED0380C|nr:hypothetical protein [Novosphingobium resinovorum]
MPVIAALLAAALSLSALPQAEQDDLHCLAYLSVAAGKVQGDLREKVDGGALYYFGRIQARDPQLDIAAGIDAILHAPGYGPETYQADKARCHAQLDPLAGQFEAWKGKFGGAK